MRRFVLRSAVAASRGLAASSPAVCSLAACPAWVLRAAPAASSLFCANACTPVRSFASSAASPSLEEVLASELSHELESYQASEARRPRGCAWQRS